jgi:hypothetical protein
LDDKYARARVSETRFAEAEVEEKFGLTVSKLRTAQRYKLVEPDYEVSAERRISRRWGVRELVRVYVCNIISYHLSIPFIAAISVMLEWDRITGYEKADTDKRMDPAFLNPDIELTDRMYLAVRLEEQVHFIGKLVAGEDGRQRLEIDCGDLSLIPGGRQRISFCAVDTNAIRDKFLVLYDEIENGG